MTTFFVTVGVAIADSTTAPVAGLIAATFTVAATVAITTATAIVIVIATTIVITIAIAVATPWYQLSCNYWHYSCYDDGDDHSYVLLR